MGGDATWVEATTSKSDFRSTCYASASSTRGSIPLLHFPPAARALTVCVSLTHNSRARSLSRRTVSLTPVIVYAGRRPPPRFTVSSTLAYLTQSALLDILALSLAHVASFNKPNLKVCDELSLRRSVISLKCFATE